MFIKLNRVVAQHLIYCILARCKSMIRLYLYATLTLMGLPSVNLEQRLRTAAPVLYSETGSDCLSRSFSLSL